MKSKNDINELILAGESRTVEFKANFHKDSIETLVAFANTIGGVLLLGVDDTKKIKGIHLGKETLTEWLSQIKSSTSPSIFPELYVVELEGKNIVVVEVLEYPIKPVCVRGKYFARRGASNHQLVLSEISEMYLQALQLSYDYYTASQNTIDDLSLYKIERFIESVNQTGRFQLDLSPLLALEKLRFLVNHKPTIAAMLLFAKNPEPHHIRVGRFKTASDIIDDKEITDTLFEVVDQAMKFIITYISVSYQFDGGLQRKERYAYPLQALREALVNAVVHRDYTDSSDIQIKIFDDRITIYSPGKLYGGLKISDLYTDRYSSKLRNKLVAEAFYLTKKIEKYGSGFIRIRKELESYPEIAFTIEEIANGLLLTFVNQANKGVYSVGEVNRNDGYFVNEPNTSIEFTRPHSVQWREESALTTNKINENHLLNVVQQFEGIRVNEIAIKLNCSKRTVERLLQKLKCENKIEFRGATKNGGYYKKNL